MTRMHLRQPGFTDSICGPFTKSKNRIQKFKETGDWRYIYQDKLDKNFFQHNMAFAKFKNLPKRKAFDKSLCDEAITTAKNPKFDGYQWELA